jgi:hypothetical protein
MTDATNGGPAGEPTDPLTRLALDLHCVARAPAGRPAADFTARVRPFHPLALGPETGRIVWQR